MTVDGERQLLGLVIGETCDAEVGPKRAERSCYAVEVRGLTLRNAVDVVGHPRGAQEGGGGGAADEDVLGPVPV